MWAARLVSIAQSRFRRDRRTEEDENHFSEPSIQVIAATQTGRASINPENTFETHHSMPLLFNLCRRWAWPAIEFRCQSHPHEADARDASGDTALHWVAFGNPPLEVVRALLLACPNLAALPNKEGNLPLHVVASYRASGDVIRELVQAYPEGAGIPVPRSGACAMHLMCDVGGSEEGFRALLETNAGVGSLRKIDRIFGQTPLQILNARKNMSRYFSIITRLQDLREQEKNVRREAALTGADIENHLERFEAQVEEIKEWDFWLKTALLIQSEYKGSKLEPGEDVTRRIVHACAAIPNCPQSLLGLAALLHPEQLVEQDDKGQVPLHKVMASPRSSHFHDVFCPEATRICDHNGKYPLHIAVEIGDRCWREGVGLLVAANPIAVEGLDLDEQLYPLLWSKLPGGLTTLFQSIQAKPGLFDWRLEN